MLDRVKPSYRYYQYLAYPALGFNCGVEAHKDGVHLLMKTTWAPRFYQPRIVPRSLPDIVTKIAFLSTPQSLDGLKPLVSAYEEWLAETRSLPIASGIDNSIGADLDLIVVYKIDRLTRSLTDFPLDAKCPALVCAV
jgi:hypothetical protein